MLSIRTSNVRSMLGKEADDYVLQTVLGRHPSLLLTHIAVLGL